MRSPQVSNGSPMETHTSVCTKSTPFTALSISSVTVMRAPLCLAKPSHISTSSGSGNRAFGPQIRTSIPNLAPINNKELPMLLRASPIYTYLISLNGLSQFSIMVNTSANICVGWNSSVKPLNTGTPAYSANSSTISCLKPRYSMASYILPNTRAVSFILSLWPI